MKRPLSWLVQPLGYKWLHILGLAVSLWLQSMLVWLYGGLVQAVDTLGVEPTVTCVIAPPLTDEQRHHLQQALSQLPGVRQVLWPSPALIAHGMGVWLGLEPEPEAERQHPTLALPHVAELILTEGQDGEQLALLAAAIPGIVAADGSAPKDLAFGPLLQVARNLLYVLLAFGLFAAASLMIVAVGELMLQQQQQIGILQLLGATWWFALKPFVLQAGGMGCLAGSLAAMAFGLCQLVIDQMWLPELFPWLGRAVLEVSWQFPWWLLPPCGAWVAGSMALVGGLRTWCELRVPAW